MSGMYKDYLDRTDVGRKILNIEYKLVLLFLYIVFLVFLLISQKSWLNVLYVHFLFVFIFSIFYFGRQFLYIFAAPLFVIFIPIEQIRIKRFLKAFKQNTPAEVAIILGHSDWTKLEAWIKPNSALREITLLVQQLKLKRQNFSFYPKATLVDVEEIMKNKDIKEVYLLGHGSSHLFQLSTDDILYYCEFNSPQYKKEFVHQIHCGTEDGKSLIDYVVPEENKERCFLVRKSISGDFIEKKFKQTIKDLEKKTTV